jgi:putative transposase
MPGRSVSLVNNEVYHVYNRGSDKRVIFLSSSDFKRFEETFCYYKFSEVKPKFSQYIKIPNPLLRLDDKLVEIIAYCLMPNHFHFLVRQKKDGGISSFLSQLSNSYTKYFNTKYKRVGPLLQGDFKAVRIETDEQLIHVSRYIHLNPIVAFITDNLKSYPWSSYQDYLNPKDSQYSIQEVLNLFPSSEKYREFVNDQIDYGRTLELIKHKTIDDF